ncbi:phosphatidate phosphatase [Synchytrium microbalum]|uniref:phosphatidate phosphatase n=1 Tax=Synchytrium microbalum TaxID=1806994 RepID=A0A507C826_9FUNG|nr:phosphatidate phosphatase [Synchytrium microbalum]TPX34174.1 phosphatidate phosphatase [Synchytrium microbalum]
MKTLIEPISLTSSNPTVAVAQKFQQEWSERRVEEFVEYHMKGASQYLTRIFNHFGFYMVAITEDDAEGIRKHKQALSSGIEKAHPKVLDIRKAKSRQPQSDLEMFFGLVTEQSSSFNRLRVDYSESSIMQKIADDVLAVRVKQLIEQDGSVESVEDMNGLRLLAEKLLPERVDAFLKIEDDEDQAMALIEEKYTQGITMSYLYGFSSHVVKATQTVVSSVSEFYRDINPATLSGAIDVVVVKQKNGEFACSPFHVRFGKLKLLTPREKVVEVTVNGKPVDVAMKLGEAGEAFFVIETEKPPPSQYATSPIPHPQTEIDDSVEPLDLGASIHEATAAENGLPSDADIVVEKTSVLSTAIRNASSNDLPALESPTSLSARAMEEGRNSLEEKRRHTRTLSGPMLEASIKDLDASDLDSFEVGSLPKSSMASMRNHTPAGPLSDGGLEYTNTSTAEPHQWSWHWGDLPTKTESETTVIAPTVMKPDELTILDKDPLSLSEKVNNYLAALPEAQQTRPISPEMTAIDFSNEVAMPGRYNNYNDNASSTVTSPPNSPPRALMESTALGLRSESMPQTIPLTTIPVPVTTQPPSSPPLSPVMQASMLPPPRLEVSTCGWKNILAAAPQAADDIFKTHKVDFQTFSANPLLLADPLTVFRINGRYYNWAVAGPLIVSLSAFGESLAPETLAKLVSQQAGKEVVPEEADNRRYSLSQGFSRWWTRGSTPTLTSGSMPPPLTASNPAPASTPAKQQGELDNKPVSPIPEEDQHKFGKPANDVKSVSHEAGVARARTESKTSSESKVPESKQAAETRQSIEHNYAKTLRLTSEQLKALDLKPGSNSVTFTVTQGKATTSSQIFLWNYDDKVVISDIDGTITKSDALGHLFAVVGRDWTHAGVAGLYTNIRNNGYQILYLTSRAIGQASYTREYLKAVSQGSYTLPPGPVIMSPDRLFTALHREVIMRKPEEFKIACLRDIKRLFGEGITPFYAGFGNRITDALSYRSVDVPPSRIFTIDPTGEIRLELMVHYKSSYVKLNDLVDQIFPPLTKSVDTDFSDYNFWKQELIDVDLDLVVPDEETFEDEEDDLDRGDGGENEGDSDHSVDGDGLEKYPFI